jgi:hypothetical protein
MSSPTTTLLAHLERLAPFGIENPKPLFLFTEVSVRAISPFGKNGEHVKVRVFDSEGRLLSQFQAFSSFQRFGGSVALIDTNNDGTMTIVSGGDMSLGTGSTFVSDGTLFQASSLHKSCSSDFIRIGRNSFLFTRSR